MDDLGVTMVQIRENRYDAVIHMVTAADGAEDFYASQVEARYESVDEAREKDELLRQAYMGHQRWILIGNRDCSDFQNKIQNVKESVLDVLGYSAGAFFHKKFLLAKDKQADNRVLPIDLSGIRDSSFEEIFVTETMIDYKTSEGEVIASSVEKRGGRQSFMYTLNVKLRMKGQVVQKKKSISPTEYISYKQMVKKGTIPLKSKRVCIIDNGVYIIINYFTELDGAPMLGIIQVRHGNQSKLQLPDYIKVYRDVTDEPQYMPDKMCKESYYMDPQDKAGTLTN